MCNNAQCLHTISIRSELGPHIIGEYKMDSAASANVSVCMRSYVDSDDDNLS